MTNVYIEPAFQVDKNGNENTKMKRIYDCHMQLKLQNIEQKRDFHKTEFIFY